MLAICRELPERFTTRSGTSLEPRSLGTGVAESLVEAEPAFMAELWPARRTELERIRADLLGKLKPKEKEVYAFVQSTLGIADPQPVLPVYLVADAPWPGAMTYLSRRGGVCFVGMASDGASQLLETVLHETLHALDASSSGPDVFDELRTALRGAGVEPTDARLRDLPHMVMFVHAAETVRRLLDPDHNDYGTLEIGGRPALYIRDQASFNAVQPVWRAYLDGGIDRQEAVRRIVAAAACAPAIEE
jgi:hypothetical protein